MKKLILFFTTIFLVGACSQSEQNSEPASQTMVEYVWMTAGPDFNAENLAFTINTWNQIKEIQITEQLKCETLQPIGGSCLPSGMKKYMNEKQSR